MLFLPQLTPGKKKQLTYLLLLSLVLVIIIWLFWVTKFGYNRQTQTDNIFFNSIRQNSQTTVGQYENFKNQVQTTWQQFENVIYQSQQQAEIIDQMKERLATSTASVSTSSVSTSTEVQVELINQEQE